MKTYGGETSAFLTPGTATTSGATAMTPAEEDTGGSGTGGSGNEDEPPLLEGDENSGGSGSDSGGEEDMGAIG